MLNTFLVKSHTHNTHHHWAGMTLAVPASMISLRVNEGIIIAWLHWAEQSAAAGSPSGSPRGTSETARAMEGKGDRTPVLAFALAREAASNTYGYGQL